MISEQCATFQANTLSSVMHQAAKAVCENFTPTGNLLQQTNFFGDPVTHAHNFGQERVYTSSAETLSVGYLSVISDLLISLLEYFIDIVKDGQILISNTENSTGLSIFGLLRLGFMLFIVVKLVRISNAILSVVMFLSKLIAKRLLAFVFRLGTSVKSAALSFYYRVWTLKKFKIVSEGIVIDDASKELVTHNSQVCLRIRFRDENLLIPIKDGLMLAAAGGPPKSVPPTSKDIMEKALEGSTLRLSTSWPKGVVALATSESKIIGMGCRCLLDGKDVLLTAAHVLKAMSYVVDELYIVNQERKIILSRLEPVVMKSTDLDLVAIEIKSSKWTALGVKQLALNFDVKADSSSIKLYGFSGGKLAVSEGRFKPSAVILIHYASTQPSWSGTPLIDGGGKVVGIHRAAGVHEPGKRDYNIATSVKWLQITRNESDGQKDSAATHRDQDVQTWQNRKEAKSKKKFGDEKNVKRFAIEYRDRDVYVATTETKYNYTAPAISLTDFLANENTKNSWSYIMENEPDYDPDAYLGEIESQLSFSEPVCHFQSEPVKEICSENSDKVVFSDSVLKSSVGFKAVVDSFKTDLSTTKHSDPDLQVILEQNNVCFDLYDEKEQTLIYNGKFYEAGKSNVKFFFQVDKIEGKLKYVKKFAKKRPEILNFAWPGRSDATEKSSVETHATKFMPVWNLTMNKTMKSSLKTYVNIFIPKYKMPNCLQYALIKNQDNSAIWREKSGFNDVIMYIDSTRNPGSPYSKYGSTNAIVLKTELERITSVVRARLVMLANDKTVISNSPTENLRAGLYDPIRFFNKYEPTKIKKIEERRERLISSVSLADRIVSQMLISPLIAAQKETWQTSDHTMGFGLRLEDDIKNVVDRFCKTYDNKKLHHVDLDATAWDWQFGEVGYDIESYIITESCINPTDAFRNAIRNLKQLEKRKIFQFSKGDMIAQVTPGLVASGKFDTTQQNSNVNSFIMYHFGAVNRRVAGDDGLAAFRAGFRNRYIEANMNMKFNDIDKDGGKFEFCSNYWGINKEGQYFSYPVHYEKMVFKFLSINYNKAIEFEELKRELKFHPDFEQIVEDIEDLELPFEDGDETPETGEGTEILKSA